MCTHQYTQGTGKFGIEKLRRQTQKTKKKAGKNPGATIISATPLKGKLASQSHINQVEVILSCVNM